MDANLKEYRFLMTLDETVTAYSEKEARDILEGGNPSATFLDVKLLDTKELARTR